MPQRFCFTGHFDFKPTAQITVGFRKGFEGDIVTGAAMSGKITKAVVAAALSTGAGVVITKRAKISGGNGGR